MDSHDSETRAAAQDLAQALLVLREELLKTNMSSEDITQILQAYASRPQVELIKPLEVWTDEDLEEEAERRKLSWLTLESDADLLDEVERRDLLHRKGSLSDDEFEREAERRGFRQTLAEFPIEEIREYLEVQGRGQLSHGGGGGNGGPGGNNRRRNKKRSKRRNHPSHN